jgi:hypothetical protein
VLPIEGADSESYFSLVEKSKDCQWVARNKISQNAKGVDEMHLGDALTNQIYRKDLTVFSFFHEIHADR